MIQFFSDAARGKVAHRKLAGHRLDVSATFCLGREGQLNNFTRRMFQRSGHAWFVVGNCPNIGFNISCVFRLSRDPGSMYSDLCGGLPGATGDVEMVMKSPGTSGQCELAKFITFVPGRLDRLCLSAQSRAEA